MKYILDTCTVSYFLKGNDQVIKWFQILSPSDLSMSVITVLEIEYGFKLKKSKQMDLLYEKWQQFFDVVRILEFSSITASIAADIKAILKQQGQLIGEYDILISATALEHQLICVTNNISEFERIKNLEIVDWSSRG